MKVPAEVMGLPATAKSEGMLSATDVTVPVVLAEMVIVPVPGRSMTRATASLRRPVV